MMQKIKSAGKPVASHGRKYKRIPGIEPFGNPDQSSTVIRTKKLDARLLGFGGRVIGEVKAQRAVSEQSQTSLNSSMKQMLSV